MIRPNNNIVTQIAISCQILFGENLGILPYARGAGKFLMKYPILKKCPAWDILQTGRGDTNVQVNFYDNGFSQLKNLLKKVFQICQTKALVDPTESEVNQ